MKTTDHSRLSLFFPPDLRLRCGCVGLRVENCTVQTQAGFWCSAQTQPAFHFLQRDHWVVCHLKPRYGQQGWKEESSSISQSSIWSTIKGEFKNKESMDKIRAGCRARKYGTSHIVADKQEEQKNVDFGDENDLCCDDMTCTATSIWM